MRAFFIAFAALFLTCLPGQAEDQTAAFRDMEGGWHEAWLGVSDLPRMRRFFEEVAGWRVIKTGKLDRATLDFLAPNSKSGRYAVIRSDDYPQGWVRLIELEGVERAVARPNAQAWDTGGVFSLMTRSQDAERNLRDAERLGWTAYNEPYDFAFGDIAAYGRLELRNLVLRGPDGVNVAIYQWRNPKREDAPPAGAVSKAFNAMQMVADLDRAVAFYQGTLGFRLYQRGSFVDPEPRSTNFALPINLSTSVRRDYAILIPQGAKDEAGRVELMQFVGLEGRRLSAAPRLSDRGIASLIYPVRDLDERLSALRDKGVAPLVGPAQIELPPYGVVRAATIVSPDGALLTLVDPN
jgi:catechol 2,3-dioxygenase-like lactoylglutathione lyase family enzyme